MCRYYKVSEFAKLIGVSPGTLREYDRKGILIPHHRLPNGYRIYSEDQYQSFLQNKKSMSEGTT